MSKPVNEWDEAYILSLPENDEFERKGAMLLDLKAGADENEVLDELAKQLSAFANTGGGKIIYGVERDGSVRCGGVSIDIKPGGTKEWLERKIPSLTEYEIVGFAVDEFTGKSPESRIAPGKAIYVISVPDSERAPHQSVRNKKYFIRNGSQSEAARHRIVEDIRNRQRHPNVVLGEFAIELAATRKDNPDHSIHTLETILTLSLVNTGSLKSAETFLMAKPETGYLRFNYDKEIAAQVLGTLAGFYEWQLTRSLHPRSTIKFRAGYNLTARKRAPNSWLDLEERKALGDVAIEFTIFADSAPPRLQRVTFDEMGLLRLLNIHFT